MGCQFFFLTTETEKGKRQKYGFGEKNPKNMGNIGAFSGCFFMGRLKVQS